ncbi:MAG: prepilin peptidase [Candidatus Magasanikbacteria bacterium]|jgi:prepilin signal peptidase PulO-like enzyme (type II secretory pathway)
MAEVLYSYYSILGWFSYVWIFLMGLILGSFLNSWIWRRRENIRIITANRSVCFHCHHQLSWYDNIPLVSYIFLRGRCRSCFKHIPWRYPLVEFVTGALFVFVAWYHVCVTPSFVFYLWARDVVFVTLLLVIFVYDYLYQEVITDLVWFGVIAGFLINYYLLGFSVDNMVIGATIAGGFFGIQYLVSRGRWIGGGDVRLGVLMGIWLGWSGVVVAMSIAYLTGALCSVWLLATAKAKAKSAIPFGTFLAIGTFIAMYFGKNIIHWYLQFLK